VTIKLSEKSFDVLIIGAGPAGTSAAIELGKSGLSVALLEKATFPRDKTCGDALSVDVVNQLAMLSPELASDFDKLECKTPSYGVSIFSPNRHQVDIPFVYKGAKTPGYICKRLDFDNLLAQQLKKFPSVQLFENCKVDIVETQYQKIVAQTTLGIFSGKMLIAADGSHSIVSKKLTLNKKDKKHSSAGLRIYYEGITSFHHENFIELYFFQDILPGYLWIFPLPDNKANVGIGMLSSAVSEKNVDLKKVLQHILSTDLRFKERFQNAKPLETVKGYSLPLGSKKRVLSGDHFLLAGDAASLIDPFSGEGIANAIRSGRVAAAHIVKCFKESDFSKAFNTQYDTEIYRRMWKELQLSRALQRLCSYPRLFNFIVRKANQNKEVHELLVDALANSDKKKKLLQPGFYYRLLFNKKVT
jgi:geranylgeranyl reductase family protein